MKYTSLGLVSTVALMAALPALGQENFNRIASFAVPANSADQSIETSSEIIAATDDGMTLVYTDSPAGVIGFIDISDAANPVAGGSLDVGGEPTSVSIIGQTAFVGVNTSESYVAPSGFMMAVDVAGKTELGRCDLGGQPDSVATAKDGSFVVVAIENERDEDLNDGELPQLPAGNVSIIPLVDGAMACDDMIVVDMTGLAEVGASDPEPEFVSVNGEGEIVVTMQENNHIVVLDNSGEIMSSFSAGAVTLEGIDEDEEGALTFNATQTDVLREPDSVDWIDDTYFATANEGDYKGGSRGWTIFDQDGNVVYEDGTAFERAIIEIGHYPEERSGNKGVEPESIEFGQFGDKPYIFVGSERGSIVGVYTLDGMQPTLKQLLPSGIAPEGIVAIPSRNLLITANEADLIEDGGVRSHVMIYELQNAPAAYPMITSAGADELIGWTALSGMVADPKMPGILYAVNDSFLRSQPRIFTIDATATPARITGYVDVTRDGMPAQKLDLEGITTDGDGGFWLASEGRTDRLIPHALYHVNADGEIEDEIPFPAELLAVEMRFGSEGVTRIDNVLWIAIQREWQDDAANLVKMVRYDIDSGEWSAVHYQTEAADTGWVGLSEITAHDGSLYIVERDNQIGAAAKIKRLYRVSLDGLTPASLGSDLPVVSKELVHDFLPDLMVLNGYVQDKVEGFAIDASGEGFVMTDNDGVDDHSGETLFWSIGQM